jgi:hypothetical protein|tara:strand:- start:3632 stop:3835 length:204 start_codon:yes stop_codon:yes gene_type:complete
MDKNTKEAVGAENPTVSEMLKQTMVCLKPDDQLRFEAALWWEEIEAKQRATAEEMEEYYANQNTIEL